MQYLIKVTITWAIFLLVYELLYKNSGRFLMNRCYLLLSLFAGLVLPLIKLPTGMIARPVAAVWNNPSLAADNKIDIAGNGGMAVIDWSMVLWSGYFIVAGGLLLATLLDIVYIIRHAIYGHFQVKGGYKIFSIDKAVAPYSFMGWIFLSNATGYNDTELNYVIRHEAAHNKQRHWIDNLAIQLVCILLWFHPLVWRYRYLIKLQHEYEADQVASAGDAYGYGHFLLAQTLMKGVPSIAHSFHFSPIKNRIDMLTKNQSSGLKKYLLMVPVLAFSIVVMATTKDKGERKREGNMTFYKGNAFEWEKEIPADTIIMENQTTGKQQTVVSHKNPAIIRFNKEIVIDASGASTQPQFKAAENGFGEYLKNRLKDNDVKIPGNISQIALMNVVINKEGQIVYYDLSYSDTLLSFDKPPYDYDPTVSTALEQIISDSPNWIPGTKDGKPQSVFIQQLEGGIWLKQMTMRGLKMQNRKIK